MNLSRLFESNDLIRFRAMFELALPEAAEALKFTDVVDSRLVFGIMLVTMAISFSSLFFDSYVTGGLELKFKPGLVFDELIVLLAGTNWDGSILELFIVLLTADKRSNTVERILAELFVVLELVELVLELDFFICCLILDVDEEEELDVVEAFEAVESSLKLASLSIVGLMRVSLSV